MIAKIVYFETGTKKVREAEGELLFGDALLSDYIGVKRNTPDFDYLLVPSATIIEIQTYELEKTPPEVHFNERHGNDAGPLRI